MAETIGNRAPARWWVLAASLFAAAFGLVLVIVVSGHSGGNVFDSPAPIAVAGDHFKAARGQGHASEGAFVLDALDASGIGILSASVAAFTADNYPRVACTVRGADTALLELSLIWQTREQPNQVFRAPLEAQSVDNVAASPAPRDGWRGTVTGLAVLVRGSLSQPLVLQSCSVLSVSARTALVDIGRQWSAPFPFKGSSIHLPFDAERSHAASLLIVVALAQALALAGYYVLARRRRWSRDPRVFVAIFLMGWLVLDVRWQVNLWRQLEQTVQQFAGKSAEEKHVVADDHAMFEWMQQVNRVLPTAPVRILFLADNLALRTRGAFFLYPQSVYYDPRPKERTPSPEQVRSGDYVLLFEYSGLTYDRAQQQLLWPAGTAKPAEELLAPANGIVLLRMR